MPISAFAIWFAEADAVLLGPGDAGGVDTVFAVGTAASTNPAGTSVCTRFWTVDDAAVTRLSVDSDSSYGIFVQGQAAPVQLRLEPDLDTGHDLLLVVFSERDAGRDLDLRFLPLSDGTSAEADLQGYARDALALGPDQDVRLIFRARCAIAQRTMRLSPARMVWPRRLPRSIELQPLADPDGPYSRIDLVVKHDRSRQTTGSTTEAPSIDDAPALVLVWRSLFAGRLARQTEPGTFMRDFQNSLGTSLGRPVKLASSRREVAAGTRQPIAKGVLRSSMGDTVASVDMLRFAFEGPCDINDIVLLCAPSRRDGPHGVVSPPGVHDQVRRLDLDGIEESVVCWRAELDRLAPITWEDADRETNGALRAQLTEELKVLRSRWESDEQTADRPAEQAVAELLRAEPIRHADPLRAADLFRVDGADPDDALGCFLADLAPDLVRRLRQTASTERRDVTNVVRFMPLARIDIRPDPAAWERFERDAADLYQLLVEIYRRLDPSGVVPTTGIRRERPLWSSIANAVDRLPEPERVRLGAVVGELASGPSGRLRPLDPRQIRDAASALVGLYKHLTAPTCTPAGTEPDTGPDVVEPADT